MLHIEPDFMDLTVDLDPHTFWKENLICTKLTTKKPRCGLHFSPDDHWLFEFMAIPSTLRYYNEKAYRDSLHPQVNKITEEYIGCSFFEEDTWEHNPKRIENLFGCNFEYHDGRKPWLIPVTTDPKAFSRILDRAESINMQTWALPVPFLREWDARKDAGKEVPFLGTGSRGPVTIMTSVLNAEKIFFWYYDHPALMRRF